VGNVKRRRAQHLVFPRWILNPLRIPAQTSAANQSYQMVPINRPGLFVFFAVGVVFMLAMLQLGGSLVRIFIADDRNAYRTHLRTLPGSVKEWKVCAEVVNGIEAVEKHSHFQPHLTVMDFNMSELNGLVASREILRQCPNASILLLTVFAPP